MRIVLRGLVWLVVVCAAGLPAVAATPSEFYLAMLQRGIAAHDAGRFENATSSLRVAAFGFVDSVEHYQTAQLYLALSYDRLSEAERARESARKLVAAERVERKYASLKVPPATRANFEALARRALTAADLAVLGRTAEGVISPQTATQAPATTPSTTAVAPRTTTSTNPPQTATTQPGNPTPQQPAHTPVQPPTTSAQKPNGTTATPPQNTTATTPQTTPAQQPATTPVQQPTTPVQQPSNPATQQPGKPATQQPGKPATQQPNPAPEQPKNGPTTRGTPTRTPSAMFADAERALTASKLPEARAIYRELLGNASLQRADLLRLAEGFYRARDFANALRAFERLGALRRGEEPYRYYIAVALYETGQYARAKQELAAVLPFIEVTPDVERYRVKIEGALN